jgi:hypothetical protein
MAVFFEHGTEPSKFIKAYNPEYSRLRTHRLENLRSYIKFLDQMIDCRTFHGVTLLYVHAAEMASHFNSLVWPIEAFYEIPEERH